jgi:hypothetical protein
MSRLRSAAMASTRCQNESGIVKNSVPRPGMGPSVRSARFGIVTAG